MRVSACAYVCVHTHVPLRTCHLEVFSFSLHFGMLMLKCIYSMHAHTTNAPTRALTQVHAKYTLTDKCMDDIHTHSMRVHMHMYIRRTHEAHRHSGLGIV